MELIKQRAKHIESAIFLIKCKISWCLHMHAVWAEKQKHAPIADSRQFFH